MNIELTDLIISQLKTFATMMAAGMILTAARQIKINKFRGLLAEIIFWIGAAIIIPMFLYYCTYGKVTFCAVVGMVTGVFLWKIFIKKVFK